jgi:hypothetical protein
MPVDEGKPADSPQSGGRCVEQRSQIDFVAAFETTKTLLALQDYWAASITA